MTIRRFCGAFIVTGLVASMTMIAIARRQRSHVESELAVLSAAGATAPEALRRAQAAAAEVDRRAAEQAREIQQLEAALAARSLLASAGTAPSDEGAILARDAALRAKFERLVRHDMEEKYGALFRQWRLPPDRLEALHRLMIRDAETSLDLRGAADAHGIDPDHPGAVKLRARQFEELLAAEKSLLAPDQYETLQLRQRVEGARAGADGLAALMIVTEPLNAAQCERLTQVLAEASRTFQAGGRASWGTIDWAQVNARLPMFLSAGQAELVRDYAYLWQLTAEQMGRIFPELSPKR